MFRNVLITNQNGTFYYHRDHQGSIVALTDSSGEVVESFTYDNHYGTIINHTKDVETNNPYAYTGRELDTSELYYYRARYYDATLERFLSEDPIGFASGDFNFYRYTLNNPIYFRDPQGHFAWIPAIALGLGAYYGVQGAITIWDWLKDAKHKIDNPVPFSDPNYHKRICDVADGAREVGKELTHDIISAGIPFNKPVREAGNLIYDVAQ